VVFPSEIHLDRRRAEMHLVVTGLFENGEIRDLTREAEFTPASAEIVEVQDRIARPGHDGNTELLVRVAGHEVRVPVRVSSQDLPDPVSFVYGAQVALTRAGCNSGACHGSPSGKGGFRLSLRGYDPVLDELTLIREDRNRRTNQIDPDQSLLLRKPLMIVAHGGGRRIDKSDMAYDLLRDWIAEGMKPDPEDAPKCVKVEVFPKDRVFQAPNYTQQVVALAHFSDGRVKDVTRIVSYSSSNESVATVDGSGLVTGQDRGESAILVRYLEQMATAEFTYLKDIDNFAWNNPPENNYIDTLTFAKLKRMQILPSEVCTDEEFIRRVTLDTLGMLPTPAETSAFLADQSPEKRDRLIEDLLNRPDYAEFWGLRWGDLLRVNTKRMNTDGVHKFRRWIVAAFRDNMPYDEFARELLTADGSTAENPPANYFRAASDTNDCTETTSQLFLGIRIQCAKCHNHPFERWTQDNYYGIGAFFQRLQRQARGPNDMMIWTARTGEITQPRTGKTMTPWLPLSGDAKIADEDDRRETLVTWLARPTNPFFAQAEVNRIWGYVMGRGIVEPVDDFRDSNPPVNRELLQALAQDFVKSGFDRKHILRTILRSRTYQLSSRKNEFNQSDELYFSHYRTRLLGAEQLLDAICQVTGVAETFAGLPPGTRAVQLPSPDANHPFLKVFGQPAREMACSCERSGESNLSQALQMINGPLIHEKLRNANNRLRTLVKAGKSSEEVLSDLYLAALCRRPTPPEMSVALQHLASQPNQEQAWEDICWALLNAKEFLFQH